MKKNNTIVTFSHLRWDFVYQRPQHLLSRMAQSHNVVFIEEPVFDESPTPYFERTTPEADVMVCRPHTPVNAPGFDERQLPHLQHLVQQLLREEGIDDYIAWLYTPMALPLCEGLKPQAVVYDCMDELSAFLNAPPQLLEHEAHLLKLADIVFTGGPSLYRAKKDSHHNVFCFPSSVEAKHFATAANGMVEAVDQRALPHPRLGYFGVIDERIDTGLLRAMAEAHPEWQIVMVGPVVKIDPAALPRNPNIHYFGQRTYSELPSYLAGWDVCLLPFARNNSTRFISPTKTLEYMAARKSIVSTPITDVAEPYGEIVYLGEGPETFVNACERALAAPAADRAARRAKMREVLSRTSWDRTVASMQEEIRKAIEKRPAAGDGREARTASRGGGEAARILIAGAGPTGLSAAYHIGDDALVLEQNDRVGGWCRSIEVNGFTFDYAGHIMFSNEPYVHQLYNMLLGENVHWQDREAWIYSKNVYTRYPFQGSLYGLPPEVIQECMMGAIEARFGPAKQPKNAAGTNGKANGKTNGNGHAAACKPGSVNDCCADGILEASAPLAEAGSVDGRNSEPRNFEEFIYKVWGSGIARHFAIPYNRKLWAVPLEEMETSWLGGRVPLPDLEEMIEGALSPSPKPMGPNARFGYPLRGGFQTLMDGWLPYLKGRLRMNTRVAAVSPRRRTVTLADGTRHALRALHLHHAAAGADPHDGRGGAAGDPRRGGRAAACLRALRPHRRRARKPHRKALDLLSRGHRLPPHLRAGQRQPPLQSSGRLRPHLRDHLLRLQAPAGRRGRADPALHRGLPQGGDLQAGGPRVGHGRVRPALCVRGLRSRAGQERGAHPRVARGARYPARGPLQRVGVLQLRSRIHRRQEGRGSGEAVAAGADGFGAVPRFRGCFAARHNVNVVPTQLNLYTPGTGSGGTGTFSS